MKTTIKDNVLHIEIPLHAPRPSATGKTLTVASSNGNKETEARIDGKPVIVGVNAYIKPAGRLKTSRPKTQVKSRWNRVTAHPTALPQ